MLYFQGQASTSQTDDVDIVRTLTSLVVIYDCTSVKTRTYNNSLIYICTCTENYFF